MAKDDNDSTVKTRILILSDTHAGAPHAFRPPPLPPADLLIHCGDLTMTGGAAQYHEALDALARVDAPVKLVIPGNHDLTLDRAWMGAHTQDPRLARDPTTEAEAEAQWRAARDLWTDPRGRAAREGVRFLDEGTHRVALRNGARALVHASPYTPAFLDWGFPYARDEDRFNPPASSFRDARNVARHPVPAFAPADGGERANVDIVVTHGPPWGRLDGVPRKGQRVEHTGCSHLLRALMRSRPLVHCFGHIHEGYGAERIEWSDAADAVAGDAAARADWERDDGGCAPWEDGILLGREGIARVGDGGEGGGAGAGAGGAEAADVIVADVSADSDSPLVRGRDTLLVNAAIMTVDYRPENRPWLIEVDLPAA